MSKRATILMTAASIAAGVASLPTSASAAPVLDPLALKNAAVTDVETVRWWGWGWGVGAGLLGGAIIGGALAAPYYYGYGPYYPGPYAYPYGPYPAPVYGPAYAPVPGYGPGPGDASAYCARKYRSYDPSTGTFLGNDGARHSCP
jgi:BA14K-like protein